MRKEEPINVSMQNESQRTFWYSAGATYCISLPLMMKLEKYFRYSPDIGFIVHSARL